MKKGIVLLLAILLCFGSLSGCKISDILGKDQEEQKAAGTFVIYYLNADGTGLAKDYYTPEDEDTEAMIQEMLEMLDSEKPKENMQALLPTAVNINSYAIRKETVVIDFNKDYRKMKKVREVLARAGIVKTLIQIPGVQTVEFTVDGEALTDSKGDPVGGMDVNTFVEHARTDINNYQYTTLTLYFTNKEGDGLVPESRSVYYSSNLPLERVVVEQLLEGPKESDAYPTLPENAHLLSVTISEDICYVNFDDIFVDSALPVQQSIPIYSIVNSLADACGVNQVQISVNGDSKMTFRETMSLNKFYKKNKKLIETKPS